LQILLSLHSVFRIVRGWAVQLAGGSLRISLEKAELLA